MIKKIKGKYQFPVPMVHPGRSTGTFKGKTPFNIYTIPIQFRKDEHLVRNVGNWKDMWGGLNPTYISAIRADAKYQKKQNNYVLAVLDGTTQLKMTEGEEDSRFGGHLFYKDNGGPFDEAPHKNYFDPPREVRAIQKRLLKSISDALADCDNIYLALMWELFTFIKHKEVQEWAAEMLQVFPKGRRGLGLHEEGHLKLFHAGTFGINEGANPRYEKQVCLNDYPVIQVGFQPHSHYFYKSKRSGKQTDECEYLKAGNEAFVISETLRTWLFMARQGLHYSMPFERFTLKFGGRTIQKCQDAGCDISGFNHHLVRTQLISRLTELLEAKYDLTKIAKLESKWFSDEDKLPAPVQPEPTVTPAPVQPEPEIKEEETKKIGVKSMKTFNKITNAGRYVVLCLMALLTWAGGGSDFAIICNVILAALGTGATLYQSLKK